MRFDGYKALVTGAAGDIGGAVCRGLLGLGANVVGVDKLYDGAGMKDGIYAVGCDVTDAAQVKSACEKALEHFGGELDILVNAAGAIDNSGVDNIEPEKFDYYMRLILGAPMLFVTNLSGALQKSKTGNAGIVNLSSAGTLGDRPENVLYNVACSGLVTYSRQTARGLAGVRCNVVSPYVVDTAMYEGGELKWSSEQRAQFVKTMAELSPCGLAVTPEDVVQLVLFVLSTDAKFMTGANMNVDSGLSTVYA